MVLLLSEGVNLNIPTFSKILKFPVSDEVTNIISTNNVPLFSSVSDKNKHVSNANKYISLNKA